MCCLWIGGKLLVLLFSSCFDAGQPNQYFILNYYWNGWNFTKVQKMVKLKRFFSRILYVFVTRIIMFQKTNVISFISIVVSSTCSFHICKNSCNFFSSSNVFHEIISKVFSSRVFLENLAFCHFFLIFCWSRLPSANCQALISLRQHDFGWIHTEKVYRVSSRADMWSKMSSFSVADLQCLFLV